MYIFDIESVRRAQEALGPRYKEFMRVEGMSAGLYRTKAGEVDTQTPHTEDEAYFVIKGRARFRSGESVQDVTAGSFIFVEAGRDHRFVDITEDLEVLVVFAPAEGSTKPPG